MPGIIDVKSGINKTIKNSQDQNIKARLSAQLKMPVIIENDARMQALGECVFGKAQNTKNTLVLNWNWGLGLGIILNGQIYHGSNGSAGEFSHIRVVPNGKLCECGKQGCLQTIASARALIEMAQERLAAGAISHLTTLVAMRPHSLLLMQLSLVPKKEMNYQSRYLTSLAKN